jgi:hypothetical protein
MKLIETLGITVGTVLFIGAIQFALGESVDLDSIGKALLIALVAGFAFHQSFKNIKI